MATFATQMEDLLRDAEAVLSGLSSLRVLDRPRLDAAIKEVRRAYSDDKIVPGPWGHRSCVEWSLVTAGALSRTNFNWTCGQWNSNLELAFAELGAALTAAGSPAHAERAYTMSGQTSTQAEESETVVPDLISAGVPTADPDAAGDAEEREAADRANRKKRQWLVRNWWWLVPSAAVGGATWYFWPVIGAALRARGVLGARLRHVGDAVEQRLLPAPQGQAAMAYPSAESYDETVDPFISTQDSPTAGGSLYEAMKAAGWSDQAQQEAAPFHAPAFVPEPPPTGQPNGSFHGLSFVGFTSVPSGRANEGSFVGFSEFAGASSIDPEWEPIED